MKPVIRPQIKKQYSIQFVTTEVSQSETIGYMKPKYHRFLLQTQSNNLESLNRRQGQRFNAGLSPANGPPPDLSLSVVLTRDLELNRIFVEQDM
jgi:hypothetical protein